MQRKGQAFDLCPEPNTEIMQRIGLLAMLLLLALSACRKNVDDVIITDEPYLPHVIEFEPVVSLVQGSLTGFVVDADGSPVEDAQVQLGSQQTNTDAYGHFFFRNIQMNSKGQFLTVNKAGFFEGSRRFFPLAGEESRVKIALLPKTFSHSFESQLGATVEANGGAQVIFPPSAIRTANGDAYTGTVQVAAFWMDPSSTDILDQMPGNLQGISTSATEVALATFGMIAVELQSPSGQKLNIAQGSKATLSMPIPASMQATAPAVMPLWSFYNGYGLWVEEGEATRQGNRYVGDVSHFSFWNCDLPYTYVDFSAQVVSASGNPLTNMKVQVRIASSGWIVGYDYTDMNGYMTGKLPEGVELILEVFDICGNLVHTENIGPFTGITDLGIIEVDGTTSETNITGMAENCDGELVENGLAIVQVGTSFFYHYFSDGSFNLTLLSCSSSNEVELLLVDIDNAYQADAIVLSAGETHDLGTVTVCDVVIDFYLTLNVNGITVQYLLPLGEVITIDSLGEVVTMANIYTPEVYGSIRYDGAGTGDFSSANGTNFLINQVAGWNLQGSFDDEFTVHEYGDVGEPVRISFSGTLLQSTPGSTVWWPVSGELRMLRTE